MLRWWLWKSGRDGHWLHRGRGWEPKEKCWGNFENGRYHRAAFAALLLTADYLSIKICTLTSCHFNIDVITTFNWFYYFFKSKLKKLIREDSRCKYYYWILHFDVLKQVFVVFSMSLLSLVTWWQTCLTDWRLGQLFQTHQCRQSHWRQLFLWWALLYLSF